MKTGFLAMGLVAALAACGGDDDGGGGGGNPAPFDEDADYEPAVAADALSASVTNELFPLPVGATWTYEAETPDGLERIEVSVESGTYGVWGAEARVVRDSAYLDDELIEDTDDWFAQDDAGNVWYMGEATAEYEAGEVISTEGSWTSGEGGALPGVNMLGAPQVGDTYRQEYLAGEAEDYAIVMSLDEEVTVEAGTFTGCMKTHDLSAIDPELDEFKYYCPGVGTVLVEEGDVREELVAYDGL
ncbi:MAG TPA: hypothetical protein VMZ28_12825 [Kofleriaceae bacterium]|nr:hypothetical protein [Kofleriaceae bacterium]